MTIQNVLHVIQENTQGPRYWPDIEKSIKAYIDQENAELKEQVEELGGQSILDTMQRNKALRDEVAELKTEIASLRSRLDECRRKQMMG